jgi:hypothetical protein
LIVLLLFALAVITFRWVWKGMRTHFCPECAVQEDMDENLIPIVPRFLWWCPACSRTYHPRETLVRPLDGRSSEDVEDGEPPVLF